jgi:predicted metal-dependent hydrolase
MRENAGQAAEKRGWEDGALHARDDRPAATGSSVALHYLYPRFHPWQHDNRELLRLWLERNDGAYRAISSSAS